MISLLLATPVFDAHLPTGYVNSLLKSIPVMLEHDINFSLMTETRNLISWARNNCAMQALKNNFDKLLFIDSDIFWEPEDLLALVLSQKEIIGGAYPYRAYPITLNLQSMGEEAGKWDLNEFRSRYTDPEVEVKKIPTGFLKIDVDVFRKLEPIAKTYFRKDPMEEKPREEKMFFPIGISKEGQSLTEDWGFCELAESVGYKLYWNVNVIVEHFGLHTFSVKQPVSWK
jgi:glycosyltransferase involved in cell wall biosynthesis